MAELPLIVITGGHDREEPGSVQADGELEYKYTLPLAKAVRDELLEGWECRVVLTRETDAGLVSGTALGPELYARANQANTLGAAFYLSLHHDAGPKDARGGSLYIHSLLREYQGRVTRKYPKDEGGLVWLNAAARQLDGSPNHDAPISYAMALVGQPIIRDTLAALGISWRGSPDRIMAADFGELRIPDCPCWLLESHFGTNPIDDEIADRPEFIPQLADGIARALVTAMGLKAKAPEWQLPICKVILPPAPGQTQTREIWGEIRSGRTYVTLPGTDFEQWIGPVATAMGRKPNYTPAPPTVTFD